MKADVLVGTIKGAAFPMFTAKMPTESSGVLLLIAILGCGCAYAPANSGTAAKAPAPIQPGRSAAKSIEDAAGLVNSSSSTKELTWQEAVARLARERTAAETCAALLKKAVTRPLDR